MMDPDYELFVAIVAGGSLSAAGRTLGISPAMISKRLTRLEERLGTRLLHRTTRRLALTPKGERLHADLLTIFDTIRDAESRVADAIGAPAGPLRVSVPTSFGRMHVAPHLGRFLTLYPDVELAIDLSDDYNDLRSGRIDLAIRITANVGPGLTAYRLADNERVLCAAPAYIDTFGAPDSVDALRMHRMLATTGQLPWRLVGPEGLVVMEGRSHVLTNSNEIVRELVLSGAGIALRSLWDVNAELRSGRLHRLLPRYHGGHDVGVYAVHPFTGAVPSALSAFVQFLTNLYDPAPWSA